MWMRILLGGLLVVGCLAAPQKASSGDGARIGRLAAQTGWLSDYRQGLAEARRTGKPLFVVFRCQP